jgi:hypothetical protein
MTTQNSPLVPNLEVNRQICELLATLAADDKRKFLKKFQREKSTQISHTLRELQLGSYLRTLGLDARYEYLVKGKTPDWVILDKSANILAIVDQLTFHQAREIDDQMNAACATGDSWTGWLPDNDNRLYQRIAEKAERYERLACDLGAALIVSIYGDIGAVVEAEEVNNALFSAFGGGVFSRVTSLSGVILFQTRSIAHEFRYFQNPDATRKLALPRH